MYGGKDCGCSEEVGTPSMSIFGDGDSMSVADGASVAVHAGVLPSSHSAEMTMSTSSSDHPRSPTRVIDASLARVMTSTPAFVQPLRSRRAGSMLAP